MIGIQPIGSYFDIDDEGYVINPASVDKIQSEWKPLVDAIVLAYKDHYGNKLSCVYLRGSVARGNAIPGISDIDAFAYVDMPKDAISDDWTDKVVKMLKKKYPFTEGVEMDVVTRHGAEKRVLILNQSVCVYGVSVEVPRVKPGREMMIHLPKAEQTMDAFLDFLRKEKSVNRIKSKCVWVMKNIVRSGFELTMSRSHRYTRDLYKCYETFVEYYPEHAHTMRKVLEYALNPTDDRHELERIVRVIMPFLVEESVNFIAL